MIKNFESNKDLRNFLRDKQVKLIGGNTEGKCYLGKDNIVYKTIGVEGFEPTEYEVDKIITEDKVKNDSFAFPKDLYLINKELTMYSADYAGEDMLSGRNLCGTKLIMKLDFKNFSKAYKKMLKNVYKLSRENIIISDLPTNIVYDGKKFTAVDTCGYEKVKYDPTQKNLESYNFAIETVFRLCYDDFLDDQLTFNDFDIDGYLKRVENKLTKREKLYRNKFQSEKNKTICKKSK